MSCRQCLNLAWGSFFLQSYFVLRSVFIVLLFESLLPRADFASAAEGQVDYLTHVKPLLKERCYACHGALKQEAGLRLDTVAFMLKGGESGPIVSRETTAIGLLLKRISAKEPAERMPPEKEGEPLTEAQIKIIQTWLENGASAPNDEKPEPDPRQHWAFQPIVRPAIPAAASNWSRNPIDAFIAKQHQQHGLTPQPEAARIVLVRRLYLDLLGLPPTLDEIAACEKDPSPQWYEQLVQRLLEDPRYGERWARHWMDIWRYSDWWGLGDQLRNSQKHMWHWRDWMVESLNNDLPYDEMVRLMLAADELHPNDLDKLRATGYLARNYFLFNRPQWMEETVEHVSKGFLGLTMNCARCHDHKYDPLAQTDYYRLRAFFEPYHVRLDMVPGEADLARDGIPRVFDGVLNEPTYRYIRGDEKNPDKSTVMQPGVPAILAFSELKIEPIALPDAAWNPDRRPFVLEAHLLASQKRMDAAVTALVKTEEKINATPTTEEAAKIAEAEHKVAEMAFALALAEHESVRCRGEAQRDLTDENQKTKAAILAERAVRVAKANHTIAMNELAVLQATNDKRTAAEKLLTTAQDELNNAKAAFEAEIKPTEKFTRLVGAAWSPTRFLTSTKDDPQVNFPATSTGRRTALAQWITDRRNPLTARVAVNHIWTRHFGQSLVPTVFDFGRKGTPPSQPELLDWLASELIENRWSMKHVHRLIVTSATYRLSSSLVGSEGNVAKDAENQYWWRRVPIRLESQAVRDALLSLAGTLDPKIGGPSVPSEMQATSNRRSLYFFHSNNQRNLFLTTFDEALVKDCYRREQSIVPQQALALSNIKMVLDAADQIAKRLSRDFAEDSTFIQRSFKVILGIKASEEEISASQEALVAWRKLPGGTAETARAHFIWALINHNDFVTLR